ncbi:MAG: flagellin FliC, partial [Gammaproteobacteria bacterium]
TNVFSLNAQRALNRSQSSMQTSLERLSSGLRINRAKDDAAGLAISERFTAQIRGLEQANRNANDGISLLQTAEGAMSEISNSLQRMRELAVQAMNGTVNSADMNSLDQEYQDLATEITRNTDTTKFNGTLVIGGANTIKFQVGYEAGDTISVTTVDVAAASGVASALGASIATSASASAAIAAIDAALDKVSAVRADFGAAQNRLESVVRNNANIIENQSAARSRIMDADFAKETANLTRTQILQQAGAAMLAQANQLPQNVLSLLR